MIRSFEIITLRLSGMRGSTEYEIIDKNGTCTVTFYRIRFSDGEDKRVADKQVICKNADILKLMNDCRILNWDGFEGKHPRGVHDGIMFSFEAVVNDHQIITAHGSENFPKYYREFLRELNLMLEKHTVQKD